MATLTPFNQLDDYGERILDLDGALAAAVDTTNDFFNSGNEQIVVSNASAGVRTLTVKAQPDPFGRGGATIGDLVAAIPAGKIGVTSFLNPAMYNAGGKCTFTLDAVATTKHGILRFAKNR